MGEDLFCEHTLDKVKKHSPKFFNTLNDNGFESVLISSVKKEGRVKGYLVCPVRRSLRIWQENECAFLYYLAELISDDF